MFANFMRKSKKVVRSTKSYLNIAADSINEKREQEGKVTLTDSGGIMEAGASLYTSSKLPDSELGPKEAFLANLTDDERTHNQQFVHVDWAYKYFARSDAESKKLLPIEYILVIGFDHKIGSIVEYTHPEPAEGDLSEEVQRSLTFLGLPDGSHSVESDYSFFMTPDGKGGLYYGVSCYRQIKSSDLAEKDESVSRSYVQKSVVLLTYIPVYGMLLAKLQPSTHAYFNQLNFSETEILQQFYNNVNQFGSENIEYSDFYAGLDIKRMLLFLKV